MRHTNDFSTKTEMRTHHDSFSYLDKETSLGLKFKNLDATLSILYDQKIKKRTY